MINDMFIYPFRYSKEPLEEIRPVGQKPLELALTGFCFHTFLRYFPGSGGVVLAVVDDTNPRQKKVKTPDRVFPYDRDYMIGVGAKVLLTAPIGYKFGNGLLHTHKVNAPFNVALEYDHRKYEDLNMPADYKV